MKFSSNLYPWLNQRRLFEIVRFDGIILRTQGEKDSVSRRVNRSGRARISLLNYRRFNHRVYSDLSNETQNEGRYRSNFGQLFVSRSRLFDYCPISSSSNFFFTAAVTKSACISFGLRIRLKNVDLWKNIRYMSYIKI